MSGASRFRPATRSCSQPCRRGSTTWSSSKRSTGSGRKLADVADFYDRLSFARIKLFAVSTGEITAMHIGMLGTMSQMFPVRLARQNLARPARARAPGQDPRRQGLRLRRG